MAGVNNTHPKKVPMRQCMGCGVRKEKKELIRIIRTPEGEIVSDTTGRKNGRGAYLCHSVQCLQKAQKRKALEKALNMPIPDDVLENLEKEMMSNADG